MSTYVSSACVHAFVAVYTVYESTARFEKKLLFYLCIIPNA